jgi:hypothetical protein
MFITYGLSQLDESLQYGTFQNKASRLMGSKLHNEELHNLYSLPNIIRIIKSRRMRWAGHVARMGGEVECIYDFGGKARRKEATRNTKM